MLEDINASQDSHSYDDGIIVNTFMPIINLDTINAMKIKLIITILHAIHPFLSQV